MPLTTYGETRVISLLSAAFNRQQDNEWPPRAPELPDLTDVHDGLLILAGAAALFTNQLPRETKAFVLSTTFIRVVSESLKTYNELRETLLRYSTSDSSRLTNYLHAVSLGETLLTALKRGLRYHERLRRHPAVPTLAKRIPVTTIKAVTDIRDAIQHGDDRVLSLQPQLGVPVTLILANHRMEVGGASLSYSELAEVIVLLHESAELLLSHVDASSASPTNGP